MWQFAQSRPAWRSDSSSSYCREECGWRKEQQLWLPLQPGEAERERVAIVRDGFFWPADIMVLRPHIEQWYSWCLGRGADISKVEIYQPTTRKSTMEPSIHRDAVNKLFTGIAQLKQQWTQTLLIINH